MARIDEEMALAIRRAKRDGHEWADRAFASGARAETTDWDELARTAKGLYGALGGAIADEAIGTFVAQAKAALSLHHAALARTSGPICRVTKIPRLARDGIRTEVTSVVTHSREWDLPEDRVEALRLLDEVHAASCRIHGRPLVGAMYVARNDALVAIASRDPIAYLEALLALEAAMPREESAA